MKVVDRFNVSKPPEGPRKFTFELTGSGLASVAVVAGLCLVWVFILGVLMGRGYKPETAVPALAPIMPSTAPPAQAENKEPPSVLKPEELQFMESLQGKKVTETVTVDSAKKTADKPQEPVAVPPTSSLEKTPAPLPKGKVATAAAVPDKKAVNPDTKLKDQAASAKDKAPPVKLSDKERAALAKLTEKERASQTKMTEKERAEKAKLAEKERAAQAKLADKERADKAKQADKERADKAKQAEKERADKALAQAKAADKERADKAKQAPAAQASKDQAPSGGQQYRVTFQVSAGEDKKQADQELERLSKKGLNVAIEETKGNGKSTYRVVLRMKGTDAEIKHTLDNAGLKKPIQRYKKPL